MIRFRNPGTQYTTQVQVFRELYKEYKDANSFDLDDMARTIANTKLMTAYGYAGDEALALSQTDNDSLNSTKMNAKMYAEVFRLLGWISSVADSSYPLTFTYIGEHIATAEDILPLYEQCVLGINNPQEIMSVRYTEKVRFFKAALFSMEDLGGIMYKHELCLGPMSIDDLDTEQYKQMIQRILAMRGAFSRYQKAYAELCASLGVKPTLPDNSTRLPIGFMRNCNWIENCRTSSLYPPKSLECLKLTRHGKETAKSLRDLKDLRLEEYNKYPERVKYALIRLGVYSMLIRAGYDSTPVQDIIDADTDTCKNILQGRQLLFSPYQTLKRSTVDAALGIQRTSNGYVRHISILPDLIRQENQVQEIHMHTGNDLRTLLDEEVSDFRKLVIGLKENGRSKQDIIEKIFDENIVDTQTCFYPFVAMLFRVQGLDCQASRPGDNGARWDAIIVDNTRSIPIEIKSPTEEMHLSLKAIRQALENKVVLLSRKTHPTTVDTTSLAVGYYLPNDRAEVTNLINDFKNTYGFSIGIIDLKTLITFAVSSILEQKKINVDELNRLEGFANASSV